MFTMTAREFNQSVAKAQRVADGEPVLVTRHGQPAYVLLSIAEYERLVPTKSEPQNFLDFIKPLPDDTAELFGEIMDEIIADRKNGFGRPPVEF